MQYYLLINVSKIVNKTDSTTLQFLNSDSQSRPHSGKVRFPLKKIPIPIRTRKKKLELELIDNLTTIVNSSKNAKKVDDREKKSTKMIEFFGWNSNGRI